MRDTDAAWLAAFIDGEGHVGLHPVRSGGRVNYQTIVFIRHTHEPTVDHVVGLFSELGLTPRVTKEIRSARHKDSFRIYVSSQSGVLALANAVQPWAVTKREHWEVVREWCESRLQAKPKQAYSERDLALAERGATMNRRGKP